jgi:hypothetical protein
VHAATEGALSSSTERPALLPRPSSSLSLAFAAAAMLARMQANRRTERQVAPPAAPVCKRERELMQHCPRCHLSIRARTAQIALDYCPRCIARARELVALISPAQNG